MTKYESDLVQALLKGIELHRGPELTPFKWRDVISKSGPATFHFLRGKEIAFYAPNIKYLVLYTFPMNRAREKRIRAICRYLGLPALYSHDKMWLWEDTGEEAIFPRIFKEITVA
jgi:hypothetical protein